MRPPGITGGIAGRDQPRSRRVGRASMRPPGITGGILDGAQGARDDRAVASMRPPGITGGIIHAEPRSAKHGEASMRPPGITGGIRVSWAWRPSATSTSFNEAAGYHRRNQPSRGLADQ